MSVEVDILCSFRIWSVSFVMSSIVLRFIENPSLDLIEKCHKDDLLVIADHFQISVNRQLLKREIKSAVLTGLVEQKLLSSSVSGREADQSSTDTIGESAEANVEVDRLVEADAEAEAKAGLPPFEPFSPATPGAKEDAQLKLRLARLRIEAEERAQVRRTEFDLRLEIRRLEIQAKKEVQLRRLELEEGKLSSGSAGPSASDSVSTNTTENALSTSGFDVSKNISLVPLFREMEVDSYFSV